MIKADLTGARWRKSSYSGSGSNDNCVEVAFTGPVVGVRDSKNPRPAALALPAASWHAFVRVLTSSIRE